ncbi:hypothetical protein BH09BAC5_BH09BAC5_09410 [soil metagenome]
MKTKATDSGKIFLSVLNRKKNRVTLVFLFLFVFTKMPANNIIISNVSITGQNTTLDYAMIQFDISWDNSWRNDVAGPGNAAPYNWDAAWVFIKYKACGSDWQHATLSSVDSDHFAPGGSTIKTGLTNGLGKGAFIFRNANGTGTFSLTGVQLRWNYGVDGVPDNVSVTLKPFAIEMVYVTQGTLNLSTVDHTPITMANFRSPGLSSITSENALPLAALRWTSFNNNWDGPSGQSDALTANYPKGYKDFYCMKYQTSQEQYVDFLNCLTYSQQVTRTCASTPPSFPVGARALTCGNPATGNGIAIATSGTSPNTPAVYGCDFNNNTIFNESGDGQNIACNYMGWGDEIAYADWSGLRPMSELEFEKACRGTQPMVIDEYAWGTAAICSSNNMSPSNSGFANESAANSCNSATNGNALLQPTNYVASVYTFGRPSRVGLFSNTTSTRISSGASYYGIMDMSGNLMHFCVSVSENCQLDPSMSIVPTYAGQFDGTMHGDGILNASGDCNLPVIGPGNPGWPGTNMIGAGMRGGSFDAVYNINGRVSDRGDNGWVHTYRNFNQGFRVVRSAP